ncbi:MAG: hypothetical protein DI537_52740, partial [Stutzerimonas stutzeri]
MIEGFEARLEAHALRSCREALQHLLADIAGKVIGLPVVAAEGHVVPLQHAVVVGNAGGTIGKAGADDTTALDVLVDRHTEALFQLGNVRRQLHETVIDLRPGTVAHEPVDAHDRQLRLRRLGKRVQLGVAGRVHAIEVFVDQEVVVLLAPFEIAQVDTHEQTVGTFHFFRKYQFRSIGERVEQLLEPARQN